MYSPALLHCCRHGCVHWCISYVRWLDHMLVQVLTIGDVRVGFVCADFALLEGRRLVTIWVSERYSEMDRWCGMITRSTLGVLVIRHTPG